MVPSFGVALALEGVGSEEEYHFAVVRAGSPPNPTLTDGYPAETRAVA